MDDFWPTKESKSVEKENPPAKKSISIDAIYKTQKNRKTNARIQNIPPPKNSNILNQKKVQHLDSSKPRKRKFKFWLGIVLIIVFLASIGLGGFWAINASQNEINILKLFGNGKYLVLLQNNAEMRPTGGFIGSFATVEFSKYRLKNINFNSNIYKLDQAYMVEHNIVPPTPLRVVADKWTLHDSNFAVSFPEAAQKSQWFYQQETGDSVDGVIVINGSAIRDMLTITGPITLNRYNTTLTSDNFFTTLTSEVEQNYFSTASNRDLNEPKSILKDLMPILVNRLMQTNKRTLLDKIFAEIREKQILFYSNDANIEQALLAKNWGGEIQNVSGDYLAVNNANLGGGKSSLNVKESLNYKVTPSANGLFADLTITRSHAGTNVWPDGINKNYLRVLTPAGASISAANLNGKDITDKIVTGTEAGKNYFALWTATAPGTSDVIKLRYQLPTSLTPKNYQLLVQKQPGNLGDPLEARFGDQLIFDGVLNQDQNFKI